MIAWLEARRAAKRRKRGRKCGRVRAELAGEMSQYEVARALGISRARVQQIEVAALAKLRAALEALELEP